MSSTYGRMFYQDGVWQTVPYTAHSVKPLASGNDFIGCKSTDCKSQCYDVTLPSYSCSKPDGIQSWNLADGRALFICKDGSYCGDGNCKKYHTGCRRAFEVEYNPSDFRRQFARSNKNTEPYLNTEMANVCNSTDPVSTKSDCASCNGTFVDEVSYCDFNNNTAGANCFLKRDEDSSYKICSNSASHSFINNWFKLLIFMLSPMLFTLANAASMKINATDHVLCDNNRNTLIGNGDPHQNFEWKQLTNNFGCGARDCSSGYTTAVSVSWGFTGNIGFGSFNPGGFNVQKSVSKSQTYTCNGNKGDTVCVFSRQQYTDYTINVHTSVPNSNGITCRDSDYTSIIHAPNTNGLIFTCKHNENCKYNGYAYKDSNIYPGGPP